MFKRALSVAWFAIRGTYEDGFVLAGMGFLWFLMAVVLPGGVLLLSSAFVPWLGAVIALTVLSLVLAPPATAALFHVAWYLAHDRRIEFGYFWQGFREYFWPSWKVAGMMLVALAILLVDAFISFQAQSSLLRVLGFILLWALLFWMAMQVYVLPLLIALEEKRLGLLFKNAAQLVVVFPLFCLLMLLVALLSTALSAVVIVLLVTVWMPFIALLFSRAFASSWDEALRIQQRYQDKTERESE
jgi:uncharacterized membrane protein YesL